MNEVKKSLKTPIFREEGCFKRGVFSMVIDAIVTIDTIETISAIERLSLLAKINSAAGLSLKGSKLSAQGSALGK